MARLRYLASIAYGRGSFAPPEESEWPPPGQFTRGTLNQNSALVIQEQRDASDNSDSQQLMKEKSAQFERQMRIASNSILSVIGVVERREKQKQVASHAGAGEARSPLGAPYDDAIILRKYLPGLLASHWVGGLYLRLLVFKVNNNQTFFHYAFDEYSRLGAANFFLAGFPLLFIQFASDKLGPGVWKDINYGLKRIIWATVSSIEFRSVLGGLVDVSISFVRILDEITASFLSLLQIFQRLSLCPWNKTLPDLLSMVQIVFNDQDSIRSNIPFLLATYGYWFARNAVYPHLLFFLLSTIQADRRNAIINALNNVINDSRRSILYALKGLKQYVSQIRQQFLHSISERPNDIPMVEESSIGVLQHEQSSEQPTLSSQESHQLSQSSDKPVVWDIRRLPPTYLSYLSYTTASLLFLPIETLFLRQLTHHYAPIFGSKIPELLPISLLPWGGHQKLGPWASRLGLCLLIDVIIKASF